MSLVEEFKRLVTALREDEFDYALCGGFAMAVHGFPRATIDVDIVVETDSLEGLRKITGKLGYRENPEPMVFQNGTIVIYRFNRFEAGDPGFITLDVLCVTDAIQDPWQSRYSVDTEFGRVSVVSKEGLISLKSIRASGQDLDDIANLKKSE